MAISFNKFNTIRATFAQRQAAKRVRHAGRLQVLKVSGPYAERGSP
jgi:hypothetical protein